MAKTFDFVITLKKKEYHWIDPANGILLLLAATCFLYQCMIVLKTGYWGNLITLYVGYPILILAWCLFCFLRIRKDQPAFFRVGLLMAASGFFYLVPDVKYMAILYIIASLLEKPLKTSVEIGFDSHEIMFNSFPSKKISWDKMSNIILKDGLLTLDFKDNKLYQMDVQDETTLELEKEFNDFCKRHLALNINL